MAVDGNLELLTLFFWTMESINLFHLFLLLLKVT